MPALHAFRTLLSVCASVLVACPAAALGCDELRAQIEQKYRAGGIAQPQLSVVDASASAAGRTVGTCGRGTRRIVYFPAAGSAAAKRHDDTIVTECKDGRVLRGGSCKP